LAATVGRRDGRLYATVGRRPDVGVVTVEVVTLVPAPALRRAVNGRVGALVVVAVVTGRVLVDVTGRGVVRVRVEVVRVGGGGGAVVVVVGAVPVPATGGKLNWFRASSTLMGYDKSNVSISWSNRARSTGRLNSDTMSVILLKSRGGGGGDGVPTPAGERVGVSILV